MDLLSHGVITYLVVGKRPADVVAGLIPDLAYYLTYPGYVLTSGKLGDGIEKNEWVEPPRWMHTLHFAFHSFPVLVAIGLFARIVTGRVPKKLLLAWALHILVDIPTHSRKNWAPQFMWPFSSYSVDGFSYAEWQVNMAKKLGILNRRPRIPPYRKYD